MLQQLTYDAHARAYLDCVNNVAVIGHSHPRVLDAQAAKAFYDDILKQKTARRATGN